MAVKDLNTSICTLDDLPAIIQQQNEYNQTFNNAIVNGSVTDTYKVATDLANIGTPDYLNDQMYYDTSGGLIDSWPDVGVPVVADVESGGKERLRTDFSQVTGFVEVPVDSGGPFFLRLTGNLESGPYLDWVSINDTTDSWTVLVSGTDTNPKYLHIAIKDNATYVDGTDLLVASETVDTSNEHERFFVDVSAINGYSDTGDYVLVLSDNEVSWVAASSGGGGVSGTAKFGKADSDIGPRVGTVAASGTVSIWTIDGSGNLSDTGTDETWWNISFQNIYGGDFVQGKLDATSGKMLFDFEDCDLSV
jgi:hypothetical protein